MATPVSICSNALIMLGANTINDLTENDDRAKAAANLYPTIHDWILRSHSWACATKRVILAADAQAPAFDYAYQYSLPGEWIRTLQVGEIGIPVDYVTEGRKILTDEASLKLVYIFGQSEALWDNSLVLCTTIAMSAVMAYAITQSAAMATNQYNLLTQELKKARAVDGQDDPPQTLGDIRLLASRFTGSFPTLR